MHFQFEKITDAPVVRLPVTPKIRFEHLRGFLNTCRDVNAYVGHDNIGGAHLDASRMTWVISVAGAERTYRHDLRISLEENLAAVDQIIGEEFTRAQVLKAARAL